MHKCYNIRLVQDLRDMQIRYLPKEKRLEQTNRTELVLRDLKQNENYFWHDIYQQITDFQTNFLPNENISGKELIHDLHLFIEDLSDSGNYSIEEINEKIWLTEDLCKRFSVSEKTISRWRTKGLVARRFIVNGKKRLVFTENSLNYFIQTEASKINRGANFKRISEKERQYALEKARTLAEKGKNQTQTAKDIAFELGRSPETIRKITKHFDAKHSNLSLFSKRRTRMTQQQRNEIYQEYKNGMSIDSIAHHFHRTTGTIYRILLKYRAERVMELSLDYIESPEFALVLSKQEENMIVASLNSIHENSDSSPIFSSSQNLVFKKEQQSLIATEPLTDISSYISNLKRTCLLTPTEEVHLFRKYNYLKYKASQLRKQLDINRPKIALITEIERLYDEAIAVKNEIVSANLRLVVSIAKKHHVNSANIPLTDLISDGNLSLMKAVEKFDYYKGNKFSTYASWAIFRNYARTIPDEQKYRERFKAQNVGAFDLKADYRAIVSQEERVYWECISQVDRFMNVLDERERAIIQRRYGLGMHNERRQTLRQVGKEMGVTKERVRQIETRALAKLRKVAKDEHLEIPDIY